MLKNISRKNGKQNSCETYNELEMVGLNIVINKNMEKLVQFYLG